MPIDSESFIDIKHCSKYYTLTCEELYSFMCSYPKDSIYVRGVKDAYTKLLDIDIVPCADFYYQLKTKSGKVLNVLGNQKVPQLLNSELISTSVDDLRPLDTVINCSLFINSMVDFKSYDFKRGQFLGIILGDGSITSDYYIRISINYNQTFIADFLDSFLSKDYIANEVRAWAKPKYSSYKLHDGNRCYSYDIMGQKFVRHIKSGITGEGTYDKCIFNFRAETLNFYLGVLDGLMVTDGTYNESLTLDMTNNNILKMVQTILSKIGINREIIEHQDKRQNRARMYKINMPLFIKKYLPLMSCKIPNDRDRRFNSDRFYYGFNAYAPYRGSAHKDINKIYRNNSVKISKRPYYDMVDVITSIEKKTDSRYYFTFVTESGFISANNILINNEVSK